MSLFVNKSEYPSDFSIELLISNSSMNRCNILRRYTRRDYPDIYVYNSKTKIVG